MTTETRETIGQYKARLKTMTDDKIATAFQARELGFSVERETYGLKYARPRYNALFAEYNSRFKIV